MDVIEITRNLKSEGSINHTEKSKATSKIKSQITRDVENDIKKIFSVFC